MSDALDSKPAPYYFISYSRQEVTFADSFARGLEGCGLSHWIDFRNLVPGHSWQHQLEEAIRGAAAILLVASRASMASPRVKEEWTTALAMGKRIVLILFEPCRLHTELEGLEWVDFTGDFEQATGQLVQLLTQPAQKVISLPPQRWIHLPIAARKFMALSSLLVVMSLIGGCSVFLTVASAENGPVRTEYENLVGNLLCLTGIVIWLPAVFIFSAMPVQFLRRTHDALTVRNVLSAVLAASLFLWIVWSYAALTGNLFGKEFSAYSYICCITPSLFITFATALYLNRLLVSKEMYRWAGPTGTLIRFARPDLTGHTFNGTPMQVAVEFAPQDRLYAQELKASITKAGHICTDDLQSADIVLPLLSAYKTGTASDPEKTRVIPILMQSCDVDKQLSRTQWVDLRNGKVSMDAVAHLLDEPDELLHKLGVLPVRAAILPNAVKWLVILLSFFLSVLLAIYFWISGIAIFYPANTNLPAAVYLYVLIVILGLYYLRRYIIYRKLRFMPSLSYGRVLGFAVLLCLLVVPIIGFVLPFLLIPLLLIPLWMLRKEVRMWLPSPAKSFPRFALKPES